MKVLSESTFHSFTIKLIVKIAHYSAMIMTYIETEYHAMMEIWVSAVSLSKFADHLQKLKGKK